MLPDDPVGPDLEALELVEDGCVSIKEACGLLGDYSRATVYRLMEEGWIRYVKHKRRRLIPRKAITRYLAEHLRGGAR